MGNFLVAFLDMFSLIKLSNDANSTSKSAVRIFTGISASYSIFYKRQGVLVSD